MTKILDSKKKYKHLLFHQNITRNYIFIAIVKLLAVMLLFLSPLLIVSDTTLLLTVLLTVLSWFTTDFYNQPQKINLLEDRLILKMLTGSVNLFYYNIKEVQQPTPQYFKLLKRKTPGFQFWGKKGWYSSKFLENIFIYLLSGNIEDQILIKYGIDYYLISVADSDELIRQLEIRCGLNK